MLTTEARAQRPLLKGIHDRVGGTEEVLEDDPHAWWEAILAAA